MTSPTTSLKLVLAESVDLLRESGFVAAMLWVLAGIAELFAQVAPYGLASLVGFSPTQVPGYWTVQALVAAVIALLATGSTVRALAWDEVGERALLRSTSVVYALPMFAAAGYCVVAAHGSSHWVEAAIGFSLTGTLAMFWAIHATVGPAQAAMFPPFGRIAVVQFPIMILSALWLFAWAAMWHSHKLIAAELEAAVAIWPLQILCFAAYDDSCGVDGKHQRRASTLGNRRTALAYAWPDDLGRALLADAGVLRPGGQLAIDAQGGFVGASRMHGHANLQFVARSSLPMRIQLGVHVGGIARLPPEGIHVYSHDDRGGVSYNAVVLNANSRIDLPPGTHRFEVAFVNAPPESRKSELDVWWVLTRAPNAPSSTAVAA